jgi:hypothetical protein
MGDSAETGGCGKSNTALLSSNRKKGRGWFEGYEIPCEIPYLGDEHPFKSFNVVEVTPMPKPPIF